jgi:acetyl esterase/lipase
MERVVITQSNMEKFSHLDADSSIADLVEHPAFKGFGAQLLPGAYDVSYGAIPLRRVASLLPQHRHVDAATVVGAVNHMIDEAGGGRTIYYDFYTEEQKRKVPDKASTGLFFFRGKPGSPFAVVCPGGSFRYVGSLHEGFPLAVELSRKGYNAFVLKYRVACAEDMRASCYLACEDLAAALSYLFKNAEELAIATRDYSLWGGSAGGWMVSSTAANGTAYFGGDALPAPCAIVMIYPVLTGFRGNVPPTFFTVSADDRIIAAAVEQRVRDMRDAGIDVACRKYGHTGHGFGLGTGTEAEGWLKHAVRFWRKHMEKRKGLGWAMALLRKAIINGRSFVSGGLKLL